MSKLERLNSRVAKLLTEVVQDVLGLVKETVSEYREKTVRTQRENECLKRQLQELQNKIQEDLAADLHSHSQSSGKTEDEESKGCEFDPNPEQNVIETDHNISYSYNLGFKDLGECKETQPEYHETAEPEGKLQTNEERSRTSCGASGDMKAWDSDQVPTISAMMQCVEKQVVKKELDEMNFSASEPAVLPILNRGHEDLGFNTIRVQGPQLSDQPHGSICVPNNYDVAAVLGSRITFDLSQLRMEHNQRDETHKCSFCGKTFHRVGNLKTHERSHTGERPYGCVQCGRCFTQAGDLKKHKRVHTGEKPYYCSQCGKRFSRGENLRRHQKIHNGEKLHLQHVFRGQLQ